MLRTPTSDYRLFQNFKLLPPEKIPIFRYTWHDFYSLTEMVNAQAVGDNRSRCIPDNVFLASLFYQYRIKTWVKTLSTLNKWKQKSRVNSLMRKVELFSFLLAYTETVYSTLVYTILILFAASWTEIEPRRVNDQHNWIGSEIEASWNYCNKIEAARLHIDETIANSANFSLKIYVSYTLDDHMKKKLVPMWSY